MLLVRHGNTGKAEVDAERALTDKGRAQCEAFRRNFGSLLVSVTNVFASSVLRTTQTAELLVGPLGVAVTPVDDLYFGRPWRTQAMRDGDADCGYAPVGVYLQRHPGVYDLAAKTMSAALADAVDLASLAEGDVMVVGHAGYLSFLALEIIRAMAPSVPDGDAWLAEAEAVVKEANVGEVCGFDVSADQVRYLANTEETDFAAAPTNDAFVAACPQSECVPDPDPAPVEDLAGVQDPAAVGDPTSAEDGIAVAE